MGDGLVLALILANWLVLGYFTAVHGAQGVLLSIAGLEIRRQRRRAAGSVPPLVDSPLLPRVSVLVPAHDEAAMITQTVTSALSIEYPDLEVVVVNDGSSDTTLRTVIDQFTMRKVHRTSPDRLPTQTVRGVYQSSLHPQLLLVDKENGGKADALNAAIDHASGRLVCSIDADTVIEPGALQLLVRPFLQDGRTIAAGGTVRVANGCRLEHARVVDRRPPRNWLAAIQAVEYPRAFLFGRLGWNRLGGNVIVSGAFGVFDRSLVIEAGGYAEDSVGEDMELVLRLRRLAFEAGRDHEVSFRPDPVAWTEAPERLAVLARQRNRWHRGLADVLARHRHVLGRRRYGTMGLVALPYYLLVELLAPVVEAVGLVALGAGLALGVVNIEFAVLFLLVAYGLGIVHSLVALTMEQVVEAVPYRLDDRLRQLHWVLVEQLGYRQATVVWRLWGLVQACRGDRRWGAQVRRGFDSVEPA